MINFTGSKVSQDANITPPTPSCDTVSPCTQSGCPSSIEQEKVASEFTSFAAPSQQQNSTQTFQSAPSFLC